MLRRNWRLSATIAIFLIATSLYGATRSNGIFSFQVISPDQSFFPSYAWPKTPAYIAVHSTAEWVTYWAVPGRLSLPVPSGDKSGDVAHQIPDPDVDFDRFTLLFVTDGPKPTPGYSTTISAIWEGPKIHVTVTNISPVFDNTTCAFSQVQTTPAAVALIPKTNKPIVFDVIEATTKGCGGHRVIENGE